MEVRSGNICAVQKSTSITYSVCVCVCVCKRSYPACHVQAPYCHVAYLDQPRFHITS